MQNSQIRTVAANNAKFYANLLLEFGTDPLQ